LRKIEQALRIAVPELQNLTDTRDERGLPHLEALYARIVSRLPALIWRLQRSRGRQVFLSSHSVELLEDRGIRPDEVAMLRPHGSEGTVVELASDKKGIKGLLEGGMTIADIVAPLTALGAATAGQGGGARRSCSPRAQRNPTR